MFKNRAARPASDRFQMFETSYPSIMLCIRWASFVASFPPQIEPSTPFVLLLFQHLLQERVARMQWVACLLETFRMHLILFVLFEGLVKSLANLMAWQRALEPSPWPRTPSTALFIFSLFGVVLFFCLLLMSCFALWFMCVLFYIRFGKLLFIIFWLRIMCFCWHLGDHILSLLILCL